MGNSTQICQILLEFIFQLRVAVYIVRDFFSETGLVYENKRNHLLLLIVSGEIN